MKNIVLIGMPGAGKSTVGVLLAKALKRPFLDTDLVIQTHENRFLQDIINQDGLDTFLDIEERTICALDLDGYVIATGGSVVYREATMNHLAAHGLIIYLSLPYPTIESRLHNITTRGIAARPDQSLYELYQERQPLYTRYADVVVDAAQLSIEETVACLAEMLNS